MRTIKRLRKNGVFKKAVLTKEDARRLVRYMDKRLRESLFRLAESRRKSWAESKNIKLD